MFDQEKLDALKNTNPNEYWRVFWWNNQMVKSLIMHQIWGEKDGKKQVVRECGLIGKTVFRFENIATWDRLNFLINGYCIKRELGLFIAPALVKMPMVNPKKTIRREQMDDFRDNFWSKYCHGYDFCIDLDTDDIKLSKDYTLLIARLLSDYNLPMSIKFSGSRGFHFTIPWEYFKPIFKKPFKAFKSYQDIIINIGKQLNIPIKENPKDPGGIDIKFNKNHRQLWRIAYTLHQKSGNVCLPLSDSQLKNFDVADMRPEIVYKKIKLLNRGLLFRENNGNSMIRQFVKDYS